MNTSQPHHKSTVRAALIENLTAQADLLPAFFNALTKPSIASSKRPAPKSATDLYNQLVSLDQHLAALLERSRKHQRRWEEMQAAKAETIRLESQSLKLVNQLESARRRLVGVLKGAHGVIESIETSERSQSNQLVLNRFRMEMF